MSISPSVAVNTVKKCSMPISSGKTLYVGGDGPGNYTRIQDAIDDTNDNDTVFVFKGIYNEEVSISKSINLIGEDKETTIIDGNKKYNAVNLLDSKTMITGFTIQNCSKSGFIAGISIINSDNNTITANIITNNALGIYLEYSNNNIITGNIISNNNGSSLFLGVSNGNTITGNIISNNYYGIYLFWSYNNTILKNNIIFNKRNADFINPPSWLNQWDQNYWNRPRLLPKIIFGRTSWLGLLELIPWINIDWHPARQPYDIGV